MEATKKIELNKIVKIVLISVLGTLLLTISAKIKIPFYPVPMTMQTFVVLFVGMAFGYKIGLATVSLYLLEGILGLPVFANSPEKGIGIVYFTGPTMGYLIGFLTACYLAKNSDLEIACSMGCICAEEVIGHVGPRPEISLMSKFSEMGLI